MKKVFLSCLKYDISMPVVKSCGNVFGQEDQMNENGGGMLSQAEIDKLIKEMEAEKEKAEK